MTDTPRSATMTVPVTMKIGPIPGDLTSFAQIFTFTLANINKILRDKGISAVVSGEHSVLTYADSEGPARSYTSTGQNVDERHFRMQPDKDLGHALEVSLDDGKTFTKVGSFGDYDFAEAIGRAWSEGRTERAK